jgi:hypothetical protein
MSDPAPVPLDTRTAAAVRIARDAYPDPDAYDRADRAVLADRAAPCGLYDLGAVGDCLAVHIAINVRELADAGANAGIIARALRQSRADLDAVIRRFEEAADAEEG